MAHIKDGGPAFPSSQMESVFDDAHGHYIDRLGAPQGGMSLRDYFAGQALAQPHDMQAVFGLAKQSKCRPSEMLARICYDWADAMLDQREKGGGA